MRTLIVIGIILFLGVWAVFSLEKKYMQAERQIIRVGDQELSVDVADTLQLQIRGLSGRQSLEEQEGMLFVYENPRVLSFWMKDMHFSIDIIWIDGSGVITGIAANVFPDTFPQTFSSMIPVQYVLEVPAGWAERHGVAPGDQVSW